MLDLQHEQLTEQFRALLVQEKEAEKTYAGLGDQIKDPTLQIQVDQIRRDKKRHIALVRRLLEIMA